MTAWVVPGVQKRSPQLFHDLVDISADQGEVKLPIMQDVCRTAGTHFAVFIHTLWRSVGVNRTLVVSSEQLDAQPTATWDRLSRAVGLEKKHPKIDEFAQVRYNTNNEKGEDRVEAKRDMQRGVYAASGFQSMREETRDRLDACWQKDCVFASLVTGHNYSACDGSYLFSISGDSPAAVESDDDADTHRYLALRRCNVDLATSFLLRGYEKCHLQSSLRALLQQGGELSSEGDSSSSSSTVKVYKIRPVNGTKPVFYCKSFVSGGEIGGNMMVDV
eukprot:gene45191-56276_t